MDMEFEKEEIGLLKAEMGHLWNGSFILAGGAIAFFLNRASVLHVVFAIIGFGIATILFYAYIIRRNEAVKLIKQLRRNK